MTLNDIVNATSAEVLTEVDMSSKNPCGCYVCDLLSLAMSKVEACDVWITVQTNVNIAAVAVLTEAACVLIAEGMHIENSVIDKANNEGVVILRTQMSAFDAAVAIGKLL